MLQELVEVGVVRGDSFFEDLVLDLEAEVERDRVVGLCSYRDLYVDPKRRLSRSKVWLPGKGWVADLRRYACKRCGYVNISSYVQGHKPRRCRRCWASLCQYKRRRKFFVRSGLTSSEFRVFGSGRNRLKNGLISKPYELPFVSRQRPKVKRKGKPYATKRKQE